MPDVQDECSKHIKENGKPYGQKRGINEKQPDLADGHIQLIC